MTYAILRKSGAESMPRSASAAPRSADPRHRLHQFQLTWTRKSERQAMPGSRFGAAEAHDHLHVAEASQELPAPLAGNWNFHRRRAHHESVHGDIIKDMVKKIEASTVGLTVPGDPSAARSGPK